MLIEVKYRKLVKSHQEPPAAIESVGVMGAIKSRRSLIAAVRGRLELTAPGILLSDRDCPI